jgi:hypothetical protein
MRTSLALSVFTAGWLHDDAQRAEQSTQQSSASQRYPYTFHRQPHYMVIRQIFLDTVREASVWWHAQVGQVKQKPLRSREVLVIMLLRHPTRPRRDLELYDTPMHIM